MGSGDLKYPFEPDYSIPPGETLAEILAERGMTQAELARRTGLSTKHVSQMISGGASITAESSLLLERVTAISARFWANLEAEYQVHRSREEEMRHLQREVAWLLEFPVKELIRRGHLRPESNPAEQLRALLGFFGVANREAWERIWAVPTAYRKSRSFESDLPSLSAWIRIGELEAQERDVGDYDRVGFRSALGNIRKLTLIHDPREWLPRLVATCADNGVVLVIEKELPKARINGIVRWVADRPMIQLSLRQRWADIFWFTFFHEAAHLLLHDRKKLTFVDAGTGGGLVEVEADDFASRTLIPKEFDDDLAAAVGSDDSIQALAKRIGIDAGVVVGRLQHDRRLRFNELNHLRTRFYFEDD